ncbi:DUF1254 domain-containing protein [Sphingomonas mali]|uniref:DUF1254 domain-containing protein n=1 Tax=Sphingomonas mali TaxID=40682 RepID=UPI000AF81D6F|nr:DUF1254 domain-containing protein [Sphingomonas mali]
MRRWLFPLLLGLVLAFAGYHLALVQFPRVLMGLATHRIAKGAGYNTMFAAPLATDKARAIVRPSPDLAYSSCPFDLSKGPVLVDVAPVPALYWSLSIFDARTDVAYVRNNIEAANQPIRVAIAQAGQPVPDGMTAVRVKGTTGIALIRILVPDRSQFPAIDAARKKSSCKALS